MTNVKEVHIPPMSARAFTVDRGRTIRITDLAGGQPGDFVAFRADDLSIKFSQARTRVENRTVRVTKGHTLWTNAMWPEAMFTITEDTCGAQDLLYVPCCRYALEKRFSVSRDGCLENLSRALEPWGVQTIEIPDPLNVFFDVRVSVEGDLEIGEMTSKPGDFLDLRAEMDCLVGISTCSVPVSGRENSAYLVSVFECAP